MIFYPDSVVTATSNAKDVQVKSVVIKNADGTSTVTKAVLPANSTILRMDIIVPTGTATATLSVGKLGGTATFFVNAQSVATAGQLSPTVANVGNLSGIPLGTDVGITTTVGTTAVTSDIYLNIYYVR